MKRRSFIGMIGKVSTAQAEAMVAEMSAKGLVRPIAGGSVRAVSNILNPGVWGTASASVAKPSPAQQPKINLQMCRSRSVPQSQHRLHQCPRWHHQAPSIVNQPFTQPSSMPSRVCHFPFGALRKPLAFQPNKPRL